MTISSPFIDTLKSFFEPIIANLRAKRCLKCVAKAAVRFFLRSFKIIFVPFPQKVILSGDNSVGRYVSLVLIASFREFASILKPLISPSFLE